MGRRGVNGLAAWAVRRVAVGVALLLALSVVTFALFFASPVDPARFACGKSCTAEQREQAARALGYDAPVLDQWTAFAGGLVLGRDFPADPELRRASPEIVTHCAAPCLGWSHVNGRTVNDLVADAFPVTASLAVVAIGVWVLGGVGLGVLAARRPGSALDRLIVASSMLAYAFPAFFVGTFALKFLVVRWGWLPYPEYHPLADGVGAWLAGLLLPATVLGLVFVGGYVRMTRSLVLESRAEPHVRTARGKGLAPSRVLGRHVLRPTVPTLVTLAGLDLAALLGGAVVVESVFAYDGLGLLTLRASREQDLPTLVGVVLVGGACVVLATLVVDLLHAVLDPRVRAVGRRAPA